MKKFSLGFVFDASLERVLLMHKNRPEWQKGKMNGIGGKVEIGESSLECMVREAFEETGLQIAKENWINFAQMHGEDWTIQVYTTIYSGAISDAKTIEDEKIMWIDFRELPSNVIPNLYWLVPAALVTINGDSFEKMTIEYSNKLRG